MQHVPSCAGPQVSCQAWHSYRGSEQPSSQPVSHLPTCTHLEQVPVLMHNAKKAAVCVFPQQKQKAKQEVTPDSKRGDRRRRNGHPASLSCSPTGPRNRAQPTQCLTALLHCNTVTFTKTKTWVGWFFFFCRDCFDSH